MDVPAASAPTRPTNNLLVLGIAGALVAALVPLGLWIAGLGSDNANGSTTVDSLKDLAASYTAQPGGAGILPTPIVAGSTITLTVTGDEVGIATGCNSGSGRARIEDGRLAFPQGLGITEMACDGPLMVQQDWVTEMMTNQPRLERSGPMLFLHWGAITNGVEPYWITFVDSTAATDLIGPPVTS